MPRRRNHRPDLSGLLILDKRLGLSSASVVSVIRGKSGGAKVGHAGTLDPLATGIVVVCLGKATKAVPLLMDAAKRYTAAVDLSAFSTTDDLEGDLSPVAAHPPPLESVHAALARFIGEIMQTPPIHSAVSVGGRRAYSLARGGRLVDDLTAPEAIAPGAISLLPRRVRIDSIDVLEFEFPRLVIDVRCGKGVYIRSLARDIGKALTTGGHLSALRRTEVGPFTLAHARPLDAIPDRFGQEELLDPAAFLPPPPPTPGWGPAEGPGSARRS